MTLGQWWGENPLLAVALVVVIIGVLVGVLTLARRDRKVHTQAAYYDELRAYAEEDARATENLFHRKMPDDFWDD